MSDSHFQDIFGIRLDATPSGLISDPTPHSHFYLPFLPQPSQFILSWDRHQICWLACPVAYTYILRKYPINTHTWFCFSLLELCQVSQKRIFGNWKQVVNRPEAFPVVQPTRHGKRSGRPAVLGRVDVR